MILQYTRMVINEPHIRSEMFRLSLFLGISSGWFVLQVDFSLRRAGFQRVRKCTRRVWTRCVRTVARLVSSGPWSTVWGGWYALFFICNVTFMRDSGHTGRSWVVCEEWVYFDLEIEERRERERVCACVCVRERGREREERGRERMWVCVCEREKGGGGGEAETKGALESERRKGREERERGMWGRMILFLKTSTNVYMEGTHQVSQC